ncbi:MAG: hypothetical protein HOQ02_04860, partial [Lysobacter sp.]|nr:hypothetical protein [Lysobacter sp.]
MSGSQEGARTRAFVIGPIGDRDAPSGGAAQIAYENGLESFERIIVPACSGLDIDAFRSDHIFKGGEIPEQVFRQIRDAQIVIADLTDANPNVM